MKTATGDFFVFKRRKKDGRQELDSICRMCKKDEYQKWHDQNRGLGGLEGLKTL